MAEIPLAWWVGGLVLMLVVSAFFSIAETAMMAINRYRLKHLVSQGHGPALRVAEMLKRTDRLLGGILIGNTLALTVATTIAGVITVRLFGDDQVAYFASPIVVGFLIIIFSEITPKVIGATYPERVALLLSWPLRFAVRTLDLPAWFINLFVRPLLWMLRIRPDANADAPKLTPEEIRTLVLESSTSFMPKKHVTILTNLFDIDEVTVQDVMLPRARIESVTLEQPLEELARQLATSYHRRLPVYRDREGDVIGILHLRKVLGLVQAGTLTREAIEELLVEPYFIAASTPLVAQLQYFQEAKEQLALVVDEYGELMGLVSIEDVIGEIVGKFTPTHLPGSARDIAWAEDGTATADGTTPVREVNRALGLELPLEGPKTLNGLILEHLQDIPEADVSIKIAGVPMEIVHAQGRVVKTVRLFRPPPEAPEPAA